MTSHHPPTPDMLATCYTTLQKPTHYHPNPSSIVLAFYSGCRRQCYPKRHGLYPAAEFRLIKEGLCDRGNAPSVSAISRLLRGNDGEDGDKKLDGKYKEIFWLAF
ncbi:unnamed protein product [Nezara viridula]|uniref:Uncharacterized protein n=1 Tax=Nezara viridula TaxID=85310 RepID=A0A9P0HM09_NEZVI|nr:unnamed protein product [Nezara viridula]